MAKIQRPVEIDERRKAAAMQSMREPIFAPGYFFGYLQLVGRIRVPKNAPPQKRVIWRTKCICGTELKVPEYHMRRTNSPKHHCGCVNKTLKTLYNREYRIYLMMHKRCYDDSHVAYHHYGGRGITIHDSWHRDIVGIDKGFEAFLVHVGPAPSTKHSIDRIHVDGNYAPGNVRWSTDKEQAANRRN